MKHIATSRIFETPSGILGERYVCTCGAASTAAQMAGTPDGLAASALFGHRPCAGIRALHESGKDHVEIDA